MANIESHVFHIQDLFSYFFLRLFTSLLMNFYKINRIIMQETGVQQVVSSYHFFFFVNTKSGNREGQQIISYQNINFDDHFGKDNRARLTFVDLFNNDNRIAEIQNLKAVINEGKMLVRVIVCGGDGTISWVLNELLKYQLNLTKCAFGIIPIGTGNDFCRTIDWPSQNFDFRLQNLLMQIKKWMNASISAYDIWDVSIQTYNNGKIFDIKDCKEYQREEKTIKKVFSNYVGMGLDARVVYTVQKIRTPYAFINKVLYGLIGFFNFFRPLKQLRTKFLSFTENSSELSSMNRSENTTGSWLEDELKSTKSVETERRDSTAYCIKKKYRGFVCLNATSYMAGLRDVWETKSVCTLDAGKVFTQQAYNDGKLEFIAYKNELGLALERCIRSGSRITQGAGPFQILLKPTEEGEITHMQIDGESVKILNLKSIRISRTGSIPGHQISIMIQSTL